MAGLAATFKALLETVCGDYTTKYGDRIEKLDSINAITPDALKLLATTMEFLKQNTKIQEGRMPTRGFFDGTDVINVPLYLDMVMGVLGQNDNYAFLEGLSDENKARCLSFVFTCRDPGFAMGEIKGVVGPGSDGHEIQENSFDQLPKFLLLDKHFAAGVALFERAQTDAAMVAALSAASEAVAGEASGAEPRFTK